MMVARLLSKLIVKLYPTSKSYTYLQGYLNDYIGKSRNHGVKFVH